MPRKRELTVPYYWCENYIDKVCAWNDRNRRSATKDLNPSRICDRKHCPIRNGAWAKAIDAEIAHDIQERDVAADIAWQEENAGG